MKKYGIGMDYLFQAERYAGTAEMLHEHGVDDHSLCIEAQIATECYLCAVLEGVSKHPVADLFKNGRIPHNPCALVNSMVRREKDPHFFNQNMVEQSFVNAKSSLNAFKKRAFVAYTTYRTVRYPSVKNKAVVSQTDITDALLVMRTAKEFAYAALPKLLKEAQVIHTAGYTIPDYFKQDLAYQEEEK